MGIYNIKDLQNENIYLYASSDSQVVKEIIREQLRRSKMDEIKKITYQDAIIEYEEYIELIVKLIKELKLDDKPIALSVLIHNLMFNGYFSNNNYFEATIRGKFYDIGFTYGIDIVSGKGCCRHMAAFYNDLFNKLGIFSYTIACYYDRYCCSLEEAFRKECNHVVNSLIYNGVNYAYDITGNFLVKFVDEFTMLEIAKPECIKPYRFYYKPSANSIFFGTNFEDAIDRLEQFKDSSKKQHIGYDEYYDFTKEALDIVYSNRPLLDDFNVESKKYTRKISDSLRKTFENLVDSYYS